MFDVHHAIIRADGTINISSFKMTKTKCSGLDTDEKKTRFLRTKMKQKGLHTRWKRYGSWTFMDDAGNASHLYAWCFTKGTNQHQHSYFFEDNEDIIVFDDLLLMRFPVDTQSLQLENHMKIHKEHVKEWLQCVFQSSETMSHSTEFKSSSNTKQQSKSGAKRKKELFIDKSISEHKNAEDAEDSGDDLDISQLSDVEEDKVGDENELEDDLDDVTEQLLLDDDDDVDASDDEAEKWSDDENVTEPETPLDDDMLGYESYTYPEKNLIVQKKPLALSLWTQ